MKSSFILLLESMTKEEAYKILGVKDDDSFLEIKKKYRSLSKTTHPDAGGKQEDFIKVRAAFEKAKNEEKLKTILRGDKPIEKEQKDDLASKISEELFKIANKLRIEILSVGKSLFDAYNWQRLIADALTADIYKRLENGELEIKELVNKLKELNEQIKKEKKKKIVKLLPGKEEVPPDVSTEITEKIFDLEELIDMFDDKYGL